MSSDIKEQLQRLAELQSKLADPDRTTAEEIDATSEMNDAACALDIPAILAAIEHEQVMRRKDAEDWVDTDTTCRTLAKRVLPAERVDGDSYGVPSVADLMEMVVAAFEQAEERGRVKGLREALAVVMVGDYIEPQVAGRVSQEIRDRISSLITPTTTKGQGNG